MEVKHVAGKVQLGDLNTKTHPRARLEELDELWSMTQIQKEGKVKIKMMRIFEKLFRGACNKRNKTKKDEQSQTEDRGHEEEELRQVRELHLQEQDEQRRREEEQRRLDEEEDDQFSLISVGQCSMRNRAKGGGKSSSSNEMPRVWITRSGECYHPFEDCIQIANYPHFPKKLCKTCRDRTG